MGGSWQLSILLAAGRTTDSKASYASASPAPASPVQRRQQRYRELPLYSSKSMKRGPPWRLFPRTGTLCKLLAGLVALTVIFHAASCGFFFCIRFPRALEFPHDMYHDIRDIYILAGKLPLCLHHAAIRTVEQYHTVGYGTTPQSACYAIQDQEAGS